MIHYICQYGETGNSYKRKYSPAGQTKMDYLILCLKELGCDYEVYSTSQADFPHLQRKSKAGNIIFRGSFATKNKYTFHIERAWAIIQLVFYLLRVKNTDTVLVYHERFYLRWINAVRKVKKWKLIFEVEEIYTQAANRSEKNIQKEIADLKKSKEDSYILSTGLLKKIFDKNSIVCSGSYHPLFFSPEDKIVKNSKDVVYAGTLDSVKGGAQAAVRAAEFLDETYHIHILGFGNHNQVTEIKEMVAITNDKSAAEVTYDGVLKGEEYRDFLKRCDIGLSTQNPEGKYNDTSFPSKIFEYLKNGLKVVSVNIPAVKTSEVSGVITFYDKQEPKLLAEAIKSAENFDVKNIKTVLDNLHEGFKSQLSSII